MAFVCKFLSMILHMFVLGRTTVRMRYAFYAPAEGVFSSFLAFTCIAKLPIQGKSTILPQGKLYTCTSWSYRCCWCLWDT